MSVARNNNFIVTFVAIVAVVSIGLGVLLFLAHKNYSTVSSSYDQQANELQRLQNLVPYPDNENLEQLRASKESLEAAIVALQTELAGRSIELEQITPNLFQDRLREMLAETVRLAADNGVELAEGFYLGFEQYQDVPPSPAAAPELYRQLKAINAIVRRVIEARVTTLAIERSPIPQEAGAAAISAASSNARQPAGSTPVLERNILRLRFTSDAGVLRPVINSLAAAEQFLIIRTLTVQNEKQEGPVRGEVATSPAAPVEASVADLFTGIEEPLVPGDATAGPATAAERLEFIVGREKIDADLRVELIDFVKPVTEQAGN